MGAGPVGLTAAAELRRNGADCRIVDRLPTRLPYAKAVGIQPRTMELWDRMGMVRAALEAAVPMRGQLTYMDGAEGPRIDLALPPDVPYGFAALPQYETERIIEEHLARFGTRIERGTELVSFVQDDDGVVSRVTTSSGLRPQVEEVPMPVRSTWRTVESSIRTPSKRVGTAEPVTEKRMPPLGSGSLKSAPLTSCTSTPSTT
ncbi:MULTISPECIES: FAD-dependent monooxygenase [unclassified Streptomyces]|uniref:FAD-dependent monooxygenase n=1 Tax=Streptomyces pratisoli TaxID=3139917 RepID=A0ACC6QKQ5_9ACTN|nr:MULTISPECIES: FAD-dependent monooxygenase [unclassified Streptomyces]